VYNYKRSCLILTLKKRWKIILKTLIH
jgi:hypothetical protein